MKIEPLFNNILIKADESAKQTKSGLFLPDTAQQDPPQEGIVIAVGAKKEYVKEGQRVIYGKYNGTIVKIEGEDYLITQETNIHAIIG